MNVPDRKVRPAVQAGRFYPASPSALLEQVQGFLGQARGGTLRRVKAVLAPHAGYRYSGAVAGSAFGPWVGAGTDVRRVVVLGPSHWMDFHGLALPSWEAMATPLGDVRMDAAAVQRLRGMPDVCVMDEAHTPEHSIEVELPFLQALFPAFEIVPLIVGRETDQRIEPVIEELWGGDETRFVISSDLSHYLGYEEARSLDKGTAGLIGEFAATKISARRACGYRPLRGFLRCARRHGLAVEAVDLRNSGDAAAPRDSVVGYGAFHFGELPQGAG